MLGDSYLILPDCQIPNLSDIYIEHFGLTDKGTFVEVGGFDALSFSNTYGLAVAGWNGLYIEPIPEFHKVGRSNHRKHDKVQHLQSAIGDRDDFVQISHGGQLSTIRPDMVELFSKLPWSREHHRDVWLTVPMTTLDKSLVKFGIKEGFELLVIDVEGAELNVLKGFSIDKYKPRMVIIELHDINPDYASMSAEHDEIKSYFAPLYAPIYKDQTNTIYKRSN